MVTFRHKIQRLIQSNALDLKTKNQSRQRRAHVRPALEILISRLPIPVEQVVGIIIICISRALVMIYYCNCNAEVHGVWHHRFIRHAKNLVEPLRRFDS